MEKDVYIRLNSKPFPSNLGRSAVCLDYNLELKFIFLLGEVLCDFSQSEEFIYPGEIIAEYSNVDKAGYQKIINQWEIILIDLLNTNNLEKEYSIIMPDSYVDWLHYHEDKQYWEIGERLMFFSSVVTLKGECLYKDLIGGLMQSLTKDLCNYDGKIESIFFSVLLNPESLFAVHLENMLEDTLIDLDEELMNGWGISPFPVWRTVEKDFDFKDGLVRCCEDSWWNYMDKHGIQLKLLNLACSWGYNDAQDFSEGLAGVKEIKWGYINTDGNRVIPCMYDEVKPFFEGLACVKKNGKWGYINKEGEEVVECCFDFAGCFSNRLALVKLDEDLYYIDRYGNRVVECYYVATYTGFNNDLAAIKQNDKWGFIDKNGDEIIPCIYEDYDLYSEYLACVQLDGKWGFVNKKNQTVIPFIYEEAYSFQEKLAVVNCKGKYGFVNKHGDMVVSCVYDECSSFSEGLACVKQGDKWGYINCRGEIVVPLMFNDCNRFSNGMARVQLAENQNYIYINRDWFVKS